MDQLQQNVAPETFQDQSVQDDEPTGYTWQASEYLFKKKGFGWHLWLLIGVAILITVMVLSRQDWLAVGVFAAMTGALIVYGNKPPQTLSYTLDDVGVTVGEKFYPYELFKSFSVLQEEGWHSVDLEPTKRFMGRITLLFEEQNRDGVAQILASFLPRLDRQPDLIDRLARRLKF